MKWKNKRFDCNSSGTHSTFKASVTVCKHAAVCVLTGGLLHSVNKHKENVDYLCWEKHSGHPKRLQWESCTTDIRGSRVMH